MKGKQKRQKPAKKAEIFAFLLVFALFVSL